MNDSQKLLKSILGDRGYETLEKAIYKQRTQAVIDPLEYYLPLIVVPRTIISWLVQTIKPMKQGELKDVKFPGRDDIAIHIEKQAPDQYRMEFVQAGRVIHSFEKQSLPAASGHMMTVGELYDDFDKGKSSDEPVSEEVKSNPDLERAKEYPKPGFAAVQQMISMANVQPKEDPENIKWTMSHANVREMTAVIGKLVDALTAKQLVRSRLESEIDEADESEKDMKKEAMATDLMLSDASKDAHQQKPKTEPKIVPAGAARADKPNSQTPFKQGVAAQSQQAEKPFGKEAMRTDLMLSDASKDAHQQKPKTEPKKAPEGMARTDSPNAQTPFKPGVAAQPKQAETPFKKEVPPITPKKDPVGMVRSDVPHKEVPFSKEQMGEPAKSKTAPPASQHAARNIASPRMSGAQHDQEKQKGILDRMSSDVRKDDAPMTPTPEDSGQYSADKNKPTLPGVETTPRPDNTIAKKDYFRKKMETLKKPYVSDAQRRWAHTDAGTKALGGSGHVHEWDEATKGKNLPEHVKKEEMGKGGSSSAASGIAANAAATRASQTKPRMIGGSLGLGMGIGSVGGIGGAGGKAEAESSKQVTSSSVPTGAGGMANIKHPKGNQMDIPLLAAEKATKAEMPKGAGQPMGPKPPQMPKPPVPPGNAPAASAAKQSQAAGKGGYKPPKTPGAPMPKNPTMKPKTPAGPAMAKSDYFRKKLGKSEAIVSTATEEQLYKSTCPQCGVSEFVKGKDGHPDFNPCSCFLVMKKDEEGKPVDFVKLLRKSDGAYSMEFARGADPEVVKLFLLTLKARLLIKKNHGI